MVDWPESREDRENRNKALRRSRLMEARILGTHTKEEWRDMVDASGSTCAKCGTFALCQKDHIVPLYQGGSDSIKNLQPLCPRCNHSKGPDDTDYRVGKAWMRPEWGSEQEVLCPTL